MMDATVDSPHQSKRPNFSVEFKRQIAEATLKPAASAALIAREHDINANLLFKCSNGVVIILPAISACPTFSCQRRLHSTGYQWQWLIHHRKCRHAHPQTAPASTRSNVATSGYA